MLPLTMTVFVATIIGAANAYYRPSDPCNRLPKDLVKTQLCCNGTMYSDSTQAYNCCFDFVCERSSNLRADPSKLHPVGFYFPSANHQEVRPSDPKRNYELFISDYRTKKAGADASSKAPKTETKSTAQPTGRSQSPGFGQQRAYPRNSFSFPVQSYFQGFLPFQQGGQQGRQQGHSPMNQYISPMKLQFWNPFKPVFQQQQQQNSFQQTFQPPYQQSASSKQPSSMSQPPMQMAYPVQQQFPPFSGFFPQGGNFLNNWNTFPSIDQFPAVTEAPTTTQQTTEAVGLTEQISKVEEELCDGMNLNIIRMTNSYLACCVNKIVYDTRLYSCVEATTTAGTPTTTAVLESVPVSLPGQVEETSIFSESDRPQPKSLMAPQQFSEPPVGEIANTAEVIEVSVVPESAEEETGVEPSVRSARLSGASYSKGVDNQFLLPTGFKYLKCGSHEYYVEPEVQKRIACCGSSAFDKAREVCEHVWGMYYTMAAVPLEQRQKVTPTSWLQCTEKLTYIFGDAVRAAHYTC